MNPKRDETDPPHTLPVDSDRQLAELLLQGHNIDKIMDETLATPVELIPSLLRLTHLD